MHLRYLLIILVCSLFFSSCIDDEGGQGTLTFTDVDMIVKGTYDGAPLVQNRTYSYNDGSRIRFSSFNFFVSNLMAAVNFNESFALEEVEFIDLTLFEGEDAAETGFNVYVGRAPIGEYTGLSFGIGLTPELNSTTPDEYGTNHPLASADRFDANLEGYKFLTITGEVDTNSDTVFDTPFNFVVGFDQNFRTISSTKRFDLLAEITNTIEIEIDLMRILDNGIQSIDFSTQTNTSANPSDEIMLLLNSNIASAISVQ